MGGRVFYTSDLHIGHQLVAEHRGFATTQEHDDWLAEQWDSTINPNGDRGDMVIVLGDTSAGGTAAQGDALTWLMNRRGRKRLIPGNHDGPHPMNKDADKWQQRYSGVFEPHMPPYQRKKIHGHNVLLCHFPYEGDRGPDRFRQYRPPNMGMPIIHGHTHSEERISHCTIPTWNGGDELSHTLQIHVGVDAWGGVPVFVDLIGELLNAGTA